MSLGVPCSKPAWNSSTKPRSKPSPLSKAIQPSAWDDTTRPQFKPLDLNDGENKGPSTGNTPQKPNRTNTFRPPATSSPISYLGKLSSSNRTIRKIPPGILIDQYESILSSKNQGDKDHRDALRRLRKLILSDGVPNNIDLRSNRTLCSLRGRIWKALLGVYRISALEYVTLVERGACDVYDKITNDAFRTLPKDKRFRDRVDDGMICRALNAFVWKSKGIFLV